MEKGSFFSSLKIRLIPGIIFCLFLLVGIKVGTLPDHFKGKPPAPLTLLNSAEAENPPVPAPAPLTPPPPSPASLTASPALGSSDKIETEDKKRTPFDLLNMSPEEIEALQKLAVRRDALMQREQNLVKRENMVAASESRVDQKMNDLKTLRETLEGLLSKYNDKAKEEIKQIVKIYENMKPKEAARIFEALELSKVLEIIENMKDVKSSAILANMQTEKAKEITTQLLQKIKPSA